MKCHQTSATSEIVTVTQTIDCIDRVYTIYAQAIIKLDDMQGEIVTGNSNICSYAVVQWPGITKATCASSCGYSYSYNSAENFKPAQTRHYIAICPCM